VRLDCEQAQDSSMFWSGGLVELTRWQKAVGKGGCGDCDFDRGVAPGSGNLGIWEQFRATALETIVQKDAGAFRQWLIKPAQLMTWWTALTKFALTVF
jgi:hypothetical protein